jgi:prepilin-type N-terminal cleavage/methylation domain-containing protein
MKNGFTLIEIIVYISLLSVLIVGVFSSVFGEIFMFTNKPKISNDNYELLIENFHE